MQKTAIKHYCEKHDVYWNPLPTNVLKGNGCIECGKEKIRDKNRRTHDEYIKELEKVNSNIICLEKYVNANTPILHKCKIDGYEWKAIPEGILYGRKCPKCVGNLKKSHEQYIEELSKVNPCIEAVDKYINSYTPILHRCKIHNIIWKTSPISILQGCGCIECGKEKLYKQKAKTHKEYTEELKITNPNIIPIEKYVNSVTPILHKCLVDNYKWNACPGNILLGNGCPKCAGNIKKSQEEYVEEVSINNPNIEVLGKYISANTPIAHKCKTHNIQWLAMPSVILHGCGCSECSKKKISEKLFKSHEQYIRELRNINSNIEVLDTYVGANTPILHKCLIDGYEWSVSPSNLLSGHGCPKCNDSKGEKQVSLWLDNHHILYEKQKRFKDCRDIKSLPFDFYLPKQNICIEYDGEQHFKSVEHFGGNKAFEITAKHDDIKNEYCKNNGISLLRIPYFKNVEEELNNFIYLI